MPFTTPIVLQAGQQPPQHGWSGGQPGQQPGPGQQPLGPQPGRMGPQGPRRPQQSSGLHRGMTPALLVAYVVFCVLGVAISAVTPFIGAIVVACAAEALFVNKHDVLAYVSLVAGTCCCIPFGVYSMVSALVVGVGTVLVAKVCAGAAKPGWIVAVGLLQVVLIFVVDAAMAASAGTTVWGQMSELYNAELEAMSASGVLSGDQLEAAQSMGGLVASMWPVVYLLRGSALTGVGMAVSLLFRGRIDQTCSCEVKPFAYFDFSPHVVWPLVIGLVCFALSYAVSAWATPLRSAGVTLLVAEVVLTFYQGLALVRHLTVTRHASPGVSVVIWVIAFLLEGTLLLVSLAGLLDIWANFRHLPRPGSKYAGEQNGDAQSNGGNGNAGQPPQGWR